MPDPPAQLSEPPSPWLRLPGKLDVMKELLRTNDIVLISAVEAMLKEEGIACFVADQHMSVLEGSAGFLQRRGLVRDDEIEDARAILRDAGLGKELRDV